MSVEQPPSESRREEIANSGLDTASVTVAGLRAAMSSRRLTAAELTSFYTGRIERLNDGLGAVISVSADAAEQAAAIDAAGRRRLPGGRVRSLASPS